MRDVAGVVCENAERTRFSIHHTENGEQKKAVFEIHTESLVDQIMAKIRFFMVRLGRNLVLA